MSYYFSKLVYNDFEEVEKKTPQLILCLQKFITTDYSSENIFDVNHRQNLFWFTAFNFVASSLGASTCTVMMSLYIVSESVF